MASPVLTPEEIAQMSVEKAKAESAATAFTGQVAGQQARAAELALTDSSFKKYYDYYSNDIIGKYEAERQAINGQYIATPVLESDIVSCASLQGGRLQPALPITDVIRVSEFDGGPLLVNPANELQYILNQAPIETELVSGWGGTSPVSTILTNSAITSSSTTLQLKDLTLTFTLTPNSVYTIASSGRLAVVKILTFVLQPANPPFIADCTIELLLSPTGTIPTGRSLKAFSGFTNAERTTKTPTDSTLQPLMDYFVAQLQTIANSRISMLNSQLTAISSNLDPDGTSELATTTNNVNVSKNFLTNYIITTDVSNTGLSSLSTERGTRTTQANSRVSQIVAAFTTRAKNYFNERYNFANNRANTSRGSLRQQKAAEAGVATSQGFAASLTAQAGAFSSIIP